MRVSPFLQELLPQFAAAYSRMMDCMVEVLQEVGSRSAGKALQAVTALSSSHCPPAAVRAAASMAHQSALRACAGKLVAVVPPALEETLKGHLQRVCKDAASKAAKRQPQRQPVLPPVQVPSLPVGTPGAAGSAAGPADSLNATAARPNGCIDNVPPTADVATASTPVASCSAATELDGKDAIAEESPAEDIFPSITNPHRISPSGCDLAMAPDPSTACLGGETSTAASADTSSSTNGGCSLCGKIGDCLQQSGCLCSAGSADGCCSRCSAIRAVHDLVGGVALEAPTSPLLDSLLHRCSLISLSMHDACSRYACGRLMELMAQAAAAQTVVEQNMVKLVNLSAEHQDLLALVTSISCNLIQQHLHVSFGASAAWLPLGVPPPAACPAPGFFQLSAEIKKHAQRYGMLRPLSHMRECLQDATVLGMCKPML